MLLSFEKFKELYSRIQKGDFDSDRKLAAEFGVNRNCIYLIRQRRHRYFRILGDVDASGEVIIFPSLDEEGRLKYTRCPKCGGNVQADIPCYACSLRDIKSKKIKQTKELINGQITKNSNG